METESWMQGSQVCPGRPSACCGVLGSILWIQGNGRRRQAKNPQILLFILLVGKGSTEWAPQTNGCSFYILALHSFSVYVCSVHLFSIHILGAIEIFQKEHWVACSNVDIIWFLPATENSLELDPSVSVVPIHSCCQLLVLFRRFSHLSSWLMIHCYSHSYEVKSGKTAPML